MGVAIDHMARQQITLLRARIEELEGRKPAAVPPGERFAQVLTLVAAEFGATREEILGESRVTRVVIARQAAMTLAQRVLGYSLPRIGRLMGRDHSTVMHGIRRIRRDAASDADFAARLDALAERIRNRGTAA